MYFSRRYTLTCDFECTYHNDKMKYDDLSAFTPDFTSQMSIIL